MAVFTLEDAHGRRRGRSCFPRPISAPRRLIETGTLVLVRGKLERDDETVRILATEIAPLDSVRERLAREVAIRVNGRPTAEMFEPLGEIFSRHRGDRRSRSRSSCRDAEAAARAGRRVSSQIRVRPSPALISEVEQIVGAGSVELR